MTNDRNQLLVRSDQGFATPEQKYEHEKQLVAEHTQQLCDEMETVFDITHNFASDPDGTKGLAVFGPPGIGKTETVRDALRSANADFQYEKGADISPAGFYGLLWFNRNPNRILVLDDVDLNAGGKEAKSIIALLKSATENTYKPRTVGWLKAQPNRQMLDHDIPTRFDYWGNVIWITNETPESLGEKKSTAKHFDALIGEGGRFTPANLDWNKKDKFLWTMHLIDNEDMLGKNCRSRKGGYTKEIIKDVKFFLTNEYSVLRGITPRFATIVAHNRYRFPDKWERMSKFGNAMGVASGRK